MAIQKLEISGFRNITEQVLQFSLGFNLIYGENGSGKTSLLEAIYCLALGKSFRTHLWPRMIKNSMETAVIFAELTDSEENFHRLGLERSTVGTRRIRWNQTELTSMAPLIELLPIQYIGVDSYRYFHDGPKDRRQFLDWGVFHVKHHFLEIWRQYDRVLKQRNAALKGRASQSELAVWDNLMVPLAESLDLARQDYVEQFIPVFEEVLSLFLPEYDLSLRYYRGWAKDKTLAIALAERHRQDQLLNSTQVGPHRADLQLYQKQVPADDVLSQGQQKLAAYALRLAQGILLQKITHKKAIFLIDDLPSELDAHNQALVLSLLNDLSTQVIVTAISTEEIAALMDVDKIKMFHVKQGIIVP